MAANRVSSQSAARHVLVNDARRFLKRMDSLYAALEADAQPRQPTARRLRGCIHDLIEEYIQVVARTDEAQDVDGGGCDVGRQ